MFTPPPATVATLDKLNASYCFKVKGPTYIEDERTDKPRLSRDKKDAAKTICLIIDKTTNEQYAQADGPDKSTALEAAVVAAIAAPKPLTPAQRFAGQAVELAAIVSDKDAEIIKLRAEIEAKDKQIAVAERARKTGKSAGGSVPGAPGVPAMNTTD